MMHSHLDAAQSLALAEEKLQAAHLRHQQAAEEVTMIEARLQAVVDRRARIRNDLAAGNLADREAGALLAVADEDLADLQLLINAAKSRAAAAVPAAEERAVALAREAIERIGRESTFAALQGRVRELEQAFLAALGTLHQQGLALGRGRALSGVYQPSDEMRRALFHGVPPTPADGVRHG